MKSCSSLITILVFTTSVLRLNYYVAAALSAKTNTNTKMSDMVPLEVLATHANSYASANGIQVERKRSDDPTRTYFECAPMSLLPNAYPKDALADAQSVATSFNELVDRVSRDAKFLERTLGGGVAEMDPFTAQILKLYKQVYVDGDKDSPANRADRLGIHRSDYMLHAPSEGEPYQLKQVELNTIAASFAGLSSRIFNLHRYLTSRFGDEVAEFLEINRKIVSTSSDPAPGVPENPTLERIPQAVALAYDRYVQRFSPGGVASNIIVLFVVQEGETNTVDQRMLEFRLFENHNIPVVRMSLTKASSEIALEDDGSLRLDGKEIAVIYYRAGYAPTDYPDGDGGAEWKARLKLECSRAAKCPSLGYHLAGTKKVQQELARPGVLERFFPGSDESGKVEAMRSCFAGLYSMGEDATAEDLQAAKDVLNGQQAYYVLKPQREGGGYNFYGDKLAEKLRENTSMADDGSLKLGEKLAEYILMQRLFPPQQKAILLRGGRVEGTGDSISELGCYGTLVVDANGKVALNEYAGFLLRTKFSNVDEGGVASGFATLSSPYLC
jgi:glutathione synthetase